MLDDVLGLTELETWLERLKDCRQLPEDDIRRLCEKASVFYSAFWPHITNAVSDSICPTLFHLPHFIPLATLYSICHTLFHLPHFIPFATLYSICPTLFHLPHLIPWTLGAYDHVLALFGFATW